MTRDTVNTLAVRLEIMDKNQQEIKQEINEMNSKLDRNFDMFLQRLDNISKENTQNYASKRTETALKRVITIVFTGVLWAILKLVIL